MTLTTREVRGPEQRSSLILSVVTIACCIAACEPRKTEEVARTERAMTVGLQPGDVAITCINTLNTFSDGDFLQIAPLVPIDNDSDIRYTDREATASGVFNVGEAVNVPVSLNPGDAGLAVIGAGTPVRFNTSGISSVSDQVFLYQGSIGNVTADTSVLTGGQFLWGFQLSPSGGWADTRDDLNNVSERLVELFGNDTAVSIAADGGTSVMFYYAGPTSGTKAQLQAAIADSANWTGTSAPDIALCPGALSVLAAGDDAGTDVPAGVGGTAGAGTGGAGAGTGGAGAGTGGVAGAGAGGMGGAAGACGSMDGDSDRRHRRRRHDGRLWY